MRRATLTLFAALLSLALWAPAARADFGLPELDVTFTDENGQTSMQAGSHPFAWKTKIAVNETEDPVLGKIPDGQLRNLTTTMPPGLIGSPTATPRCEGVDFATLVGVAPGVSLPNCSDSSVVGLVEVEAASSEGARIETRTPLFNLVPPPGVAAKFGFKPFGGATVTIEAELRETPPYNLIAKVTNVTQTARVFSSELTLWGNPSDPAHNEERGLCGFTFRQEPLTNVVIEGSCPTSNPNLPFLTLPRSCGPALLFEFDALSWEGDSFHGEVESHDEFGDPRGIGGCDVLGFGPEIASQATSRQASSPSGLAFDVDIDDPGLTNPTGRAESDIQKTVVTLPKGMTANPSQAEGLEACSESRLAREKAGSEPGEGCPQSSKIGTIEAETPLLEGTIFKGSLFIAEPYENRFGTLLALYMVLKEPRLGVNIVLAAKVVPDPKTGRLVTIVDEIPQAPVSHIRLRLREGGRSPLITPPACGAYTTEALFTPTADPATAFPAASTFQITQGPGGGPCPPGGPPPFEPGFDAGTLNNDAGAYSPFYMRLTRRDGDQDLTRFAAKLPPGLVARLAGVDRCPEAQIALAKAKSGKAELAGPSCPLNSLIGHTVAGAGTGSQLTYIGGRLYLAGPYNGAPLSVVAVTPAVAGPFDVGTVVVRQALIVNPRTGEVTADGSRSDPIPHILAGIPLSVRDIRVIVDRSEFTLNPTSCDPAQTQATLWGGGADPFSSADDAPLSLTERFQAADCQSLGFEPDLSLKLRGKNTRRGGHPALRGVFRPRKGDANLEQMVLRLPRSAFLDQAHIRTICTRVQFAAENCPKAAIYGHARALTPLLSEPLEGPVYLRSSNHNLPDLVADLHGLVDVEAVARIDSKRGGIRATFSAVPDAPIEKVVVDMQGARKGLIVNSTDLCAARRRADARLDAHNGKELTLRPTVQASCARKSR